jgi:hypothetical protein
MLERKPNRMMWKQLAAVALLGLAGCGDGNPFDYVPVSGRLTYEDGTPIPAGGMRIGFTVIDVAPKNGAFPRPAEAVVNAEGNFSSVTSYKPGDGLMPGKHKAAIYYATDAQGKLLIPKDYAHASTTPLVVEVTADSARTPLEIKVPRP